MKRQHNPLLQHAASHLKQAWNLWHFFPLIWFLSDPCSVLLCRERRRKMVWYYFRHGEVAKIRGPFNVGLFKWSRFRFLFLDLKSSLRRRVRSEKLSSFFNFQARKWRNMPNQLLSISENRCFLTYEYCPMIITYLETVLYITKTKPSVFSVFGLVVHVFCWSHLQTWFRAGHRARTATLLACIMKISLPGLVFQISV